MAFSVNTNAGALVALQNLNKTNSMLETTQSRINTGLKVASSKDNAATFAIAQKLRSQVSGLGAVQSSLDRSLSSLDVGIAAAEAVSDLLIEMKGKAVAAADDGLDADSRTSLNEDFLQLRDQIDSIVTNAEFNGINVVNTGGTDVVAITSEDAGNTITVAAQDVSLSGLALDTSTIGANATAASNAVAAIDSAIDDVNTALSEMGAGSKRLSLQKSFITKLSDAIEVGIGNLVDADLAKESANLQSLQVKQQLGLQALSIANQAPSTVLGLFR
ncbi:flagellin FljK [Kordiimonas sediminis]|uniref:Flagellin n=1 Tax=Kordiimonas sediminis TaxID=1735581 RepID=A0A919AYJ2_9PROT|nr:flagellin [Kordiimonas sediminis]GHF29561.1 flagellin FljK [Kordiimonas sediminis]